MKKRGKWSNGIGMSEHLGHSFPFPSPKILQKSQSFSTSNSNPPSSVSFFLPFFRLFLPLGFLLLLFHLFFSKMSPASSSASSPSSPPLPSSSSSLPSPPKFGPCMLGLQLMSVYAQILFHVWPSEFCNGCLGVEM